MPTVADHRVFLGDKAGAVYRLGTATTDAGGALVAARKETVWFAPFGTAGEAICHAIQPVFVHTAAVTVRLTPMVDGKVFDGVLYPDLTVDLALPQPPTSAPLVTRFDIGLSQPVVTGGVDRGRVGLRGTWFAFRFDVVSVLAADASADPGVLFMHGETVDVEEVGVTRTLTPSPSYP